MKIKPSNLALLLFLHVGSINAALLTVEWDVNVTSQYNYVAGAYDAFTPINGFASITFDNTVTSAVDYGQTTITTFGGVLGTSWVSPMTNLVGTDPFGAGINDPYDSYTFPNVSDYPSTFIEEAASQKNTISYNADSTQLWAYHVEIRATKRSPGRSGIGLDDYAFNPVSLIEFYYDFKSTGQEAIFNESYELFNQSTGEYLGGFSWSGTATISNIIGAPSPVPVPPSIWLMVTGLLGIFSLTKSSSGRKKHAA